MQRRNFRHKIRPLEVGLLRLLLQVTNKVQSHCPTVNETLFLSIFSFDQVTTAFLDEIRSIRYDKSVPPEDEGKVKIVRESVAARDIFGYGQLVKETIGNLVDSSVSSSAVFCELAGSRQMQNSNPELRGTILALSKHVFFDQPLLRAQEFLTEITIKSEDDKQLFFQ